MTHEARPALASTPFSQSRSIRSTSPERSSLDSSGADPRLHPSPPGEPSKIGQGTSLRVEPILGSGLPRRRRKWAWMRSIDSALMLHT